MSVNSWLSRCITCRYAILGKSLIDTQCQSKSCNYVPKSAVTSTEELHAHGIYKCHYCHKEFTKEQMNSESFWVFDAFKYCMPCMTNLKAAYEEAMSFRDAFMNIKMEEKLYLNLLRYIRHFQVIRVARR